MRKRFGKKMLAQLMAAVMATTTAAGGVLVVPVAVMAEDATFWTTGSQETNEVAFGEAEDWNTWDNTLRAEFEGNGQKVAVDSTLTFKMTMDGNAYQTMQEGNYIKLQAVFFEEKGNWDTVKKLGWPEYKTSQFKENADGSYYTEVSLPFDKQVDTFQSVLIQGVGTGFQGKVTISELKITAPEGGGTVLTPKTPTVAADFETGIEHWNGESGWDYSAGKEEPEKNDSGTPVEAATLEWDETTKSLKLNLDYSKDLASGWSEAKVTGTFDAVDISNYNIVTFKLRYPSGMETVRTKLFMKSTDETEILNAEGSFRQKTVEKGEDGWSTVTIRGEFKPQAKTVKSLTIGIVGPYADLHEVYLDDVTFGQLDDSEDYVKITESVATNPAAVSLDQMAKEVKLADSEATAPAKALAAYLLGVQKEDKVLVGHQNSTFRSVRDNGKTSDVYDITSSEAGLFGIDTLALAGSECSSENPMEASLEASRKAYQGGSILSLSCHMPNFTNAKIKKTEDPEHPYDFSQCDFMESKDLTPCADYILEGGAYNAQYNAYLDIIAEYALTLQEENIPILFRPFHENSGGWFWWGTSTSADSYRAIWRYMVHYLQGKGVHNLLYVYSPNGPVASKEDYLARFPGDAYVDVLGFDYYDDYADVSRYTGDVYFEALAKSCDVVSGLAKEKGKIPAIAETGIRITGAGKDSLMVTGNPTTGKDWYNKVIDTAAAHEIPYFLLWANFDSSNFFIPYKYNDTMGQEMINEFISAYNNEKSIFGNGTNFYGAEGAVSKASEITLSGYSDSVGGYLIAPKNYAVIKEACEMRASVRNAQKVEFVIQTSEADASPVVLPAVRSEGSDVYTAQLTAEKLGAIGATGTGVISVIAYGAADTQGTKLGSAQFINFNQDAPVMPANVFDNFEYYYGNDGLLQTKYGSHNSAAGCSCSFVLDAENKAEGKYAGAFCYTLAYKGSENWTGGLGRTFDTKDFSKYNALSMWVKPDGNGQKMVLQLKDSSGKEYEAFLSEFVKGTKAQYVTVPFTSFIVKGGTTSIDPSDISSCFFWCNTLPENISEEQKDDKGNYTVNGRILFDDIKAVKISDADLAKMESGQSYIVSEEPLKDISGGTEAGGESGNGSGGSSTSGGSGASGGGSAVAGSGASNQPAAATEPAASEEPAPAGSEGLVFFTETSTETNSSGKEVKVTTTILIGADGRKTGTIQKIEIPDASRKASVVITVKKDGEGAVIRASASVSQMAGRGSRAKIDISVMKQIQEAAGTEDVAVTITGKDAKDNVRCRIKANAKDLVNGKKFVLFRLKTKNGEYEMVNSKTYSTDKDGMLTVSMKDKKTYVIVPEAEAGELSRMIKDTVKAAEKHLEIRRGKTAEAGLDALLNWNNVKKVLYASAEKSIAKVEKDGTITAGEKGTTVITITVLLKNGEKKTVKMKVTVK